jgi:uncharacterized protein (DUF2147 family)
MKQIFTIGCLLVFSIFYGQNQSVVGKWKTVDDETGAAKAVVEIYEKSGKIYGKIITVLEEKNRDKLCVNCSGEDRNKPIVGMVIIKGLSKEEHNQYGSGKILDPKTGKLYRCFIQMEEKDRLKVRGYIGFSVLGRTQYWHRFKN